MWSPPRARARGRGLALELGSSLAISERFPGFRFPAARVFGALGAIAPIMTSLDGRFLPPSPLDARRHVSSREVARESGGRHYARLELFSDRAIRISHGRRRRRFRGSAREFSFASERVAVVVRNNGKIDIEVSYSRARKYLVGAYVPRHYGDLSRSASVSV